MNHLINFTQYQHQQEQYRQEQRQQEQRQQEQRQQEQRQQEQRQQEQYWQQEQYRQQQQQRQQEQHRNYFMPTINHLLSNQAPVRENYEANMGHFGSPSGHVREQGISFRPSPNQARSRWPKDELNGWFEPPFSRKSPDSSPERQTAVLDNPIALRNLPTGRSTWRSFNTRSPDFSPERQNNVVDRNRSTTEANGNSSKSGRGKRYQGMDKNKSVGTGYIGFKPEPKRRRTMEPTKAETRERLEPIKSWTELAQETQEKRKANSVSESAQTRDIFKTKNQQLTDLDRSSGRSSEGKIMTLPLWRRKWYLRYIAQGFSTEEARSMSLETVQPATANKWKVTTTWGKQQQPPATAVATNLAAATTEDDKETDQQPDDKLKIFLKPVGYPEKKLNHKEKIQLEEAIIEEVRLCRGAGRLQLPPPLRFHSIQYRLGYIEVRCFNQETAKWLLSCGSKLSTYQGPAVEVVQESMPDKLVHSISLFLPRSADKPGGYIRELLKAQNEHNIEMWQITQRKNQGTGCVVHFDIDDESAKDIAANGHKIFYRLSTVAVMGLERLDKPIAASLSQFSYPGAEIVMPQSVPQTASVKKAAVVPIQEKVLVTIDLASDNEENEQDLAIEKHFVVKKPLAKNVRPEMAAVSEVIILEGKVVEAETNADRAEEGNCVEMIVEKQAEKGNIVEKKAEKGNIVEKQAEKGNIVEKKAEENTIVEKKAEENTIVEKQAEENKIVEKQAEENKIVEKQAEENKIVEKQAEVKIVEQVLEEKNPIQKEPIEGKNTLLKENIIPKNVEEAKDTSGDTKTLTESKSNVQQTVEPAITRSSVVLEVLKKCISK